MVDSSEYINSTTFKCLFHNRRREILAGVDGFADRQEAQDNHIN